MAENEIVKPVNPKPHWQLQNQYIDEVGNVFKKGMFIGTKTELGITDEIEPKIKPEENQTKLKPRIKEEEKEGVQVDVNIIDKQADLIEKLVNLIAKQSINTNMAQEIAQAIQDVQSGRRIHRGIETIDKDDILSPPVTISAQGSMYLIYNYRAKNGDETINPSGECILLKYGGSKKFKTDKEENIRYFCKCEIRSKKLLEWIRQAPYYGIQVFENVNIALNTDPNTIQEMAQLWNRVDNFDRGELVRQAEFYKIENCIGLPVETLKKEIALRMSQDIIKKREEAHLVKAKEMAFATLTQNK